MPPAKKSLGWIWYFGLLVVLTIIAIAITGYFNLRQQMKPEQIEEAIKRWREKGPKSYRMKYLQKRGDEPDEIFEVAVHASKVIKVLRNDIPLPTEFYANYTMERKLDEIERFLEHDQQAKSRVYLRGYFHAENGRLLSYIRRVMGGRERLYLEVKEFSAE